MKGPNKNNETLKTRWTIYRIPQAFDKKQTRGQFVPLMSRATLNDFQLVIKIHSIIPFAKDFKQSTGVILLA